MSEYTPTTEEVRAAALTDYREEEITPQQFDRWLAEHDRELSERVWEEGLTSAFEVSWKTRPVNPYRQGEN